MKITDVTLTLFAWDNIPATSYGAHTGKFSGESRLGLLAITTDTGITGHAFLGSAFYPADMDGASLIRYLKPILLGQDPLDRERLYKAMWKRVRTTTVRAIGAADIALWDIAGKAAGLPIHALLGSYRDRVPAYISSAVLASPQAYAQEAQHYQSLKFAAYKIHPPQSWREDIKVCEAVRKAVGDDYLVMLDAAWSYDYAAALRVGQAIEALGYYWYEDPLADADIYNYIELRKKLHIPIMATEYPAGGLDSYTPWVKERATDFLRG
ncbi:MAG: mandelate racemase/muconate lactonizing enzyme, partial [Ramlibacter sp.]|nr:mandelate racemase/muconate lactonizing enzyme [Ramlibacter sp.]